MVLDIESFRVQEDPDALGPDGVRAIQRDRFKPVEVVDEIIAADEQWRTGEFGDRIACGCHPQYLKSASSYGLTDGPNVSRGPCIAFPLLPSSCI